MHARTTPGILAGTTSLNLIGAFDLAWEIRAVRDFQRLGNVNAEPSAQ